MQKGVDFIGVGVGAIVMRDDGKFFMALRGAGVRNEAGKWEFPGGAVKFGEHSHETARREMMEEYGMEIEVLELLGVCDHILPEENQHWLSPGYLCRYIGGEPAIKEPHKCDEIGWFAFDELPELRTKPAEYSIERLNYKFPNGMPVQVNT